MRDEMTAITKQYFLTLLLATFPFIASVGYAFETVLPTFKDSEPDFFNARSSIVRQMSEGPNFFGFYTIIETGCGTDCTVVFVGDNRTGELHKFPFGGEENSQMQLEYSLSDEEVYVSFRYNPLLETSKGLRPKYGVGENPCRAILLRFKDSLFSEVHSKQVPRYGRICPRATEIFKSNKNGISSFEEECFSKYTRFNLCETAKEIAKASVISYPQKVDKELTILSMRSEGTEIISLAMWELNYEELEHRMLANSTSLGQLKNKLETASRNYVCNHRELSALIRLGGKINYDYVTKDRRSIADIEVHFCN